MVVYLAVVVCVVVAVVVMILVGAITVCRFTYAHWYECFNTGQRIRLLGVCLCGCIDGVLRFYSRAKKEVIQSCASALTTKARDLVMNIYQHCRSSRNIRQIHSHEIGSGSVTGAVRVGQA
jgi:hypothetical protein